MIRSLWVLLGGAAITFFAASRVLLSVVLKRDDVFRLGHEIPQRWGGALLRWAGVKLHVEGLEYIPDDRARVIVANHESWFDIFALCAALPVQFRFVGKKELASIPIFGPAWVGSGHLAIDRGDRNSAIDTLQEGARRMKEQGLSIIVFPEGTRSADGEVRRFKKGAFMLALEAECPVVPVGIEGSRAIMQKGSFRIRKGDIHVRIGAPIELDRSDPNYRSDLLTAAQEAVEALKAGDPVPTDSRLPGGGPDPMGPAEG